MQMQQPPDLHLGDSWFEHLQPFARVIPAAQQIDLGQKIQKSKRSPSPDFLHSCLFILFIRDLFSYLLSFWYMPVMNLYKSWGGSQQCWKGSPLCHYEPPFRVTSCHSLLDLWGCQTSVDSREGHGPCKFKIHRFLDAMAGLDTAADTANGSWISHGCFLFMQFSINVLPPWLPSVAARVGTSNWCHEQFSSLSPPWHDHGSFFLQRATHPEKIRQLKWCRSLCIPIKGFCNKKEKSSLIRQQKFINYSWTLFHNNLLTTIIMRTTKINLSLWHIPRLLSRWRFSDADIRRRSVLKKRNAFPRRTSTGMNNEGKQMRYDPAILRGLAFIVGSKPRCTASKTKKRRVRTAMRKFTMALSAWHNCSWVTGNHWNQIQLPKKRFYTASFCSFHQFKNASFCSFHQKWSLSAQPWRNENVQMSSDDDVLYFSNSMNAMKVMKVFPAFARLQTILWTVPAKISPLSNVSLSHSVQMVYVS